MSAMSALRLVRLFPLPDVVLLPETTLPLHVFEERYRRMLADALDSDRLIGMQLLGGSGSGSGDGRPSVRAIGCAGEVVRHEPLEDGRSNILLRGAFRYRIEREPATDAPYRVAEVTVLPVAPLPASAAGGSGPARLRSLLVEGVRRLADSAGRRGARELSRRLSDEGLVNEAASRLGLDAEESYRVLAMDRLEDRYAWVLARIEGVQKRLDLLGPFRRPGGDARWN
ncbi:MAG TPA: LON peptidase substrate-binding domain-containing protein [Thermoanaerobaculia bacterium]|nr:LON peptidase substrate-binding domain-containing protein [Thermoanaerobaculia bacterium]